MKNVITKAVILAGGRGSRLHPITLEIPKPLITIRKIPLVNYNLSLFTKYGVTDVKLIIRPADRNDYQRWLREYQSSFPETTIDIIEEPEPMGTLGFIFYHLSDWMQEDQVFITNADDIKNINLAEMTAFHNRMNMSATVALIADNERKDGGLVLVHDNKIMNFSEKNSAMNANLISAGMYIISRKALQSVVIHNSQDMKKYLMFETDLFPVLAKEEKVAGFVYEGKLFDCGTLERWEQAIHES